MFIIIKINMFALNVIIFEKKPVLFHNKNILKFPSEYQKYFV